MVDFPTKEDLRSLYKSFPFEKLAVQDSGFSLNPLNDFEDMKQFATSMGLDAWKTALRNKWNDVAKAHVMMMFYYNKGIPDDPYYISPGKKGESVEYFPNFESHHFIIKDSFDFYADVYFFKMFSAFEGIWQILNVYFNLGLNINDVTFREVCNEFNKIDQDNANLLEKIFKDKRYVEGKNLRNSITHHLPIGAQGAGVYQEENAISFGISEYTSSKEIVEIANTLLEFTIEAYEQIKKLSSNSILKHNNKDI